MKRSFGGSEWTPLGYHGRVGRCRHLYVDGSGLITDSPGSNYINLCQVDISPDSLVGPVRFIASDVSYSDEAAGRISPNAIRNADEFGIGEHRLQLSSLISGMKDCPVELITPGGILIASEGKDLIYKRYPSGSIRHEAGYSSHAVMTPEDTGATLFVASPARYNEFDVVELQRHRFVKFGRYALAEISRGFTSNLLSHQRRCTKAFSV
jgi:hypothetical protein